MANNRKYRRQTHSKVDSMPDTFSMSIGRVVKILLAVAIFFVVFYFLTVYLLERDTSSGVIDTTPAEADIQYQEILAGKSFSLRDNHYFVLYYDMSDGQMKSLYTNLVSTYEDIDGHLPIYTVDMSSTFNKKYVSEDANLDVSSIDDLKISGPTLIEFENHEISNHSEGEEKIQEALS